MVSIFLPESLLYSDNGLLFGRFDTDANCYYIVEIRENRQYEKDSPSDCVAKYFDNTSSIKHIGFWGSSCGRLKEYPVENDKIGIYLDENGKISILKNNQNFENCTSVVYEQENILKSISPCTWHKDVTDCTTLSKTNKTSKTNTKGTSRLEKFNAKSIKTLYLHISEYNINRHTLLNQGKNKGWVERIILPVTFLWSLLLSGILRIMDILLLILFPLSSVLLPFSGILRFSSIGSLLILKLKKLENLQNLKEQDQKRNSVIMLLVVDALFGMAFFYIAMDFQPYLGSYTLDVLMPSVDYIGRQVESLIRWLMGIPIGLKLNSQLNQFLGKFFLHHVQLWLEYINVLLSTVSSSVYKDFLLKWPLILCCFGFSFLFSILSDLTGVLSFHVYCFYVYAARVYGLQMTGLLSLWRLFRGKKWNPLRCRVDTLPQEAEGGSQRFFTGTLLFTVLLFLLPTTALYYTIFAALRIMIMLIQNVLLRFRDIFCNFPWYSVYLRALYPLAFPANARLVRLSKYGDFDPTVDQHKTQVLKLEIDVKSFKEVMIHGLHSGSDNCLTVKQLFSSIISGQLLRWN